MFSIEATVNRRRNLPPSPRLGEHVRYLPTAKRRKSVQNQGYGWSGRIFLQHPEAPFLKRSCFLSEASRNGYIFKKLFCFIFFKFSFHQSPQMRENESYIFIIQILLTKGYNYNSGSWWCWYFYLERSKGI